MTALPSDYERQARQQIHEWKNPALGWFGQAMQAVGWPLESLDAVIKNAADTVDLGNVIRPGSCRYRGRLGGRSCLGREA